MNVLMASYGLRPAGDPWAALIGAASAAAATATAEHRRQQPLEALRTHNDIMAAYAQSAAQGRVADAEAQRLLAVAAQRLANERAAAQNQGGVAPAPASLPAPTSLPTPAPTSSPAAVRLSTGAAVGLAAVGLAALAGITYVTVKAARKH